MTGSRDKTIVITGGGRGIGLAIARRFATGRNRIFLLDIADSVAESARALADSCEAEITGIRCDVTEETQVGAAVDQVIVATGRIDVLVNNAGILGMRRPLWLTDPAAWKDAVEINLFGTYLVTKVVVPHMIAAKYGRIVNIASISGKQGSLANSAYCASKHGVLGVTKTLAVELATLTDAAITVNAVCPGVTDTDLVHAPGQLLDQVSGLLGISRQEAMERHLHGQAVQKRLIAPDEIATAVAFLASDAAYGITGQALNVCGGSVFH